jgi:hypothetical protein
MLLVPYREATLQIEEADVLLFRSEGPISWLIKRYGSGVHSHAALAHWDGDNLQCVEFREFKGGRAVSLERIIEEHPENVDVFRAAKIVQYTDCQDTCPKCGMGWSCPTDERHDLTEEVAKNISDAMLGITGLPYGWKNFWKLAKHYLPFCRLAEQNIKDNDPTNVFVCSTAVAYAYRMGYVDPVPYLADIAVTPADLARSALFKYRFTIQKDW